jgi:hypothetical protein
MGMVKRRLRRWVRLRLFGLRWFGEAGLLRVMLHCVNAKRRGGEVVLLLTRDRHKPCLLKMFGWLS